MTNPRMVILSTSIFVAFLIGRRESVAAISSHVFLLLPLEKHPYSVRFYCLGMEISLFPFSKRSICSPRTYLIDLIHALNIWTLDWTLTCRWLHNHTGDRRFIFCSIWSSLNVAGEGVDVKGLIQFSKPPSSFCLLNNPTVRFALFFHRVLPIKRTSRS